VSAAAAALASSKVVGSFTLFFLEHVAPHVPECRHDEPRDRVVLAPDDGDRRHIGGRLADLALDLLVERREVDELPHAGEAGGAPVSS